MKFQPAKLILGKASIHQKKIMYFKIYGVHNLKRLK